MLVKNYGLVKINSMSERFPDQPITTITPRLDRVLDPTRNNSYEKLYIDRLQKRYSEPHRYAHTFEHAVQKAAFIEAHCSNAGFIGDEEARLRRDAILRWAALYSDVSYSPVLSREASKAQSAATAAKDLSIWFYDSEINKISSLICGTYEDFKTSNDPDLALFLDADLSILGSPAQEYKKYAANMRQESGHQSDREYAKQRADYLIGLLKRDQIFVTDAAFNTLEPQAHRNIITELDHLGY